jgi:ParB-like chromosome segregation protein Spo0J
MSGPIDPNRNDGSVPEKEEKHITDHNVPYQIPERLIGCENPTVSVLVEQIVVDRKRRPVNGTKVRTLVESMQSLGLTSSILLAPPRKGQDGKDEYPLIAGLHRLEAMKIVGIVEARCIVLDRGDALRVELAEIDENFARNELTPAQHALQTGRRREIIRALAAQDGTLSQNATVSNQAKRRAGEETGPDPASVRDQANKTGESKDKIHRSRTRFDVIGPNILESIVGTSLDKGSQLDALIKLPEVERDDLVKRAAEGEKVSAREVRRKTEGEPQHRPEPEVQLDVGNALNGFRQWQDKFSSLGVMKTLEPQIEELDHALWLAVREEEGREPEQYYTPQALESLRGQTPEAG